MERIFESVNKAVIALIADVNNSKALAGNSLLQGSVVSARRRDNLTHVCTGARRLCPCMHYLRAKANSTNKRRKECMTREGGGKRPAVSGRRHSDVPLAAAMSHTQAHPLLSSWHVVESTHIYITLSFAHTHPRVKPPRQAPPGCVFKVSMVTVSRAIYCSTWTLSGWYTRLLASIAPRPPVISSFQLRWRWFVSFSLLSRSKNRSVSPLFPLPVGAAERLVLCTVKPWFSERLELFS